MLFRKICFPKNLKLSFKKNLLTFTNIRKKKIILPINEFLKICFKNRILYIFFVNSFRSKKFMHKKLLQILTSLTLHIQQAVFSLLKKGFFSYLFLNGLGFKAEKMVFERSIILTLGRCHPLKKRIPYGIELFTPKESFILITSSFKQILHNYLKRFQNLKYPDAYKNKGFLIEEKFSLKKKIKKNKI
uniref:Ribosomal protein L6 n=1 Tax=Aureoumbra lagunensis TaxID=44058 RepID=A0A7U0KSK0_9STRA|nr:ribosomal protein L6 [Aureoumbra lagunensis]QQW50401.1 ribosomal protein L6 [Aureoumbra lagunensis]